MTYGDDTQSRSRRGFPEPSFGADFWTVCHHHYAVSRRISDRIKDTACATRKRLSKTL